MATDSKEGDSKRAYLQIIKSTNMDNIEGQYNLLKEYIK